MGCWNGTCMISNLPIHEGDKIKLVFLRPSLSDSRMINSSGYVYSHDIFTPSFFPITGEYNDYGGIENIVEDWNYKIIEDYYKNFFGDKIVADGETKTTYGLKDIIEGIERHDLQYFGKPDAEQLQRKAMAIKAVEVYGKQGFSSEKCEREWRELENMDVTEKKRIANVSFVMIREDIWNYIAGIYKGEFYNDEAKSVDDPKFYLTAREWCEKEFNKGLSMVEKIKLILEKGDKKTIINQLKDILSSGFAMNVFTRQHLNFISPSLYDNFCVNANEEQREDILRRFTEFTCITSFLSETRRGWMIQPGAGSQHDGWETHLMLAEKVVELCKTKMKEYEEEY